MPSPTDPKLQILNPITDAGPRGVWTPADFLDPGTRDAVDKVLQRLVNADCVRRIDRTLYDMPDINALTCQRSAPARVQVIEAVARRDQIRVLIDGMTAANDLGLMTAVPSKIVVHTDARLRSIQLGNMVITFKLTAASKLYWAGRPGIRIVQALHWLRDTLNDLDDAAAVRRHVDDLLHSGPGASEIYHDLRHTFASHAARSKETLPMIGRLLGHNNPQSTSRYAHLNDEHLLNAAEQIGTAIERMLN